MLTHQRIKKLRDSLGLSANEVAEALGVSRATIYRYESADIENMGIDKISPLAGILKTTPAYLMGWTDDPTNYDDPDLIAKLEGAQFDHLLEIHNGDVSAAAKAKMEMDRCNLEDAQKEKASPVQEDLDSSDEYIAIQRGVKNLPQIEQKRALEILKLTFGDAFEGSGD